MTSDGKSDKVILFVVLRVLVSVAVGAYLALFQAVSEVGRGPDRFCIAFDTHGLPDVFLSNGSVDSAGSEPRIGQITGKSNTGALSGNFLPANR